MQSVTFMGYLLLIQPSKDYGPEENPYLEVICSKANPLSKTKAKELIIAYAESVGLVVTRLCRTESNEVRGLLRPLESGEKPGKSEGLL